MSDQNRVEPIQFRPISERDIESIRIFSSDNTSMDNFLKHEAYYCHLTREASTTLVFLGDELVGYFTLYHKEIQFENGQQENGENKSFRECLDIARLAISKERQGQGIGTTTIRLIIELAYMMNERYITLDALYEKREWYRKRGFKPAIEEEYEKENEQSLVYMYLDVYDPKLLDDYFENP